MSSLSRTTAAKSLLTAYAAAAAICAFVPLADHVSYELAFVLTLVAAAFAPAVGFAAMRLEADRDPASQRPASAAARAGAFAVVALLLPTGIILLNGLRRPICDPVGESVWLALMPAPTAWLGATLGALMRLLFHRTWTAAAAVVAVIGGSAIASAAGYYFGPASFAFDHFGGYVFGLARDGIEMRSAVFSFRAVTVAWGVAAIAIIGAGWTPDASLRRMHRSWAVGLTILLVIVSVGWGDELGWRTTDRSLRVALAGEQRADGLVIHYPRMASDATIDGITRDAIYTAAQVRAALGISPTTELHVWAYSSGAQQERLVGNGGTAFTKPWRHELHIAGPTWPHRSMRHELVHAYAAEFGSWPWGASGGFVPNAALIEGLADAFDIDDGPMTLFEDAKAMRDLRIAPDLHRLMSPAGFETESISRAYAYSAAFVRYLDLRYGTPAVRRLYRTADFTALGNLDTLIAGFTRSLDTVTSTPSERSTAARRHSIPGSTRRTCAREVYRVTDSALALAANRRWDDALAMYDRACALQPENPDLLAQKLTTALRMKPPTITPILGVASDLLHHPNTDPTLEAETRVRLGDAYLQYGDVASARRQYDSAALVPSSPATRRSVAIRRLSLDDSVRLGAVKRYYNLDGGTDRGVFGAMAAAAAHPNEPILLYLLGREYYLNRAYEGAAVSLARATRAGVPDADLTREAYRLQAIAWALLNRCEDAEAAVARLRAAGGARSEVVQSEDWVRRCRFAGERGWRPL